MLSSVRVFALVLGGLLVAPLSMIGQAQPHERVVQDTVAWAPGHVSVENASGSVTVSTWERDAVAYEARIVSEAAADPVAQTRIEVDSFAQTVGLETSYEAVEGRWSFGPKIYGYGTTHPAVHYHVVVPDSADLSVEGRDSDLDVRGLRSTLAAEMQDGAVQVADHRGALRLETHDGRVEVTDATGEVVLDTHDGSVVARGLDGPLDLETHDGSAEVAVAALHRVEVETDDGSITLRLPSDAGFDLSTDLGADAKLDGPIDLSDLRDEEGNYQGAVRGGGPLVYLSADGGRISLR
jgi:hypothetical protein